jgi:hypothetical protein
MVDRTPEFVVVRRQWNDWRQATYRIRDIEGLHWDSLSGGASAAAARREQSTTQS